MKQHIIGTIAASLLVISSSVGAQDALTQPTRRALTAAPKAPEFKGLTNWINSPPLTMAELRGKVVLVEFWTHGCINCIHVLPHIKQWHQRYKDQGLVVIGVHTPEFGYERVLKNVQRAVQRFDIQYPVAQDNGFKTWNAYRNKYWPALYLIDQNGRIVYRHFGEGDYAQTEAQIVGLLRP